MVCGRKIMAATAIALMVMVFAVDAKAQTSREVSNRLSRLENEIETLNRAVYRGEAPPPSASGNSGGNFGGNAMGGDVSDANVEVRLQGLEQQIRDLTGEMERQAFELRQLQGSFERYKTDSSLRLSDLEGGAPSSPGFQNNQPRGMGSSGTVSSGMQYIPPQSNAAAAPTPLTAADTQAPVQVSPAQQNLGSMSAQGTASDDAASRYEAAFALLRNAQYDQAETAFTAFLNNHADHPLAGNAEYWLAETHYVRGNFERAARMFATAYQKYPQGQKAPDNLLKLGLSLGSLDNQEDACVALGQLQKEFGGQPSPVTRRADQEMARLGC